MARRQGAAAPLRTPFSTPFKVARTLLQATLRTAYNFRSGTLPSGITFTRADATSCATSFASDGRLVVNPRNALLWSHDLTNAQWGVQNGASKSGQTLSTPSANTWAYNQGLITSGVSTSAFILSGSGTCSIFAYNATDGNVGMKQITLTATPTLYATNFTSTAGSNAYFGNRTGDTATSITFGGAGAFTGTYTAQQIVDAGGIPLTTTAASSGPRFDYDPTTPAGTTGVELAPWGKGFVADTQNAYIQFTGAGSYTGQLVPGKTYRWVASCTTSANVNLLIGATNVLGVWAAGVQYSGIVVASTAACVLQESGTSGASSGKVFNISVQEVVFTPRGLLIEESRANLLLNQDVAGTNLVTQSITVTAAPWSVSFTGTGTITFSGAFTGSLVGTGAANRVTQTFTPTAGALTCTVTGIVKWAQAELGAFSTSFIVTGAAAATRAADINSSTANIPGATGTVVIETTTANVLPASNNVLLSLDDGTSANRLTITRGATGAISVQWIIANVAQASLLSVGTVANGATFKIAVAWSANDFSMSLNGATPVTAASGTMPTVTSRRSGMNFTNTNQWNSVIRSVREYNTRHTNALLQALSAP